MNVHRLAENIFREHERKIHARTDRLFAALMIVQYFAGILAAVFISPSSWGYATSPSHDLRIAILLGALILALPITLALFYPGRVVTRHAIAIGQMLDSALLIHLSGGRIETHFHIFGSLAFLGFYRDWRVLVTASFVIAFDHYYRGMHWPLSVYGVSQPEPWRWIEHTAWILFEVVFIILASRQSLREMREIALRRAYVEQVAIERGRDIQALEDTKKKLHDTLESKNDFLSMCGHELKTPLTSLHLQAQIARRLVAGDRRKVPPERLWDITKKFMEQTENQITRLLRLVQDLLDHSRIQMGQLPIFPERVDATALIRDVIERYREQAKQAGSTLKLNIQEGMAAYWDRFRVEQVITNLISNAIKYGEGKQIEVELYQAGEHARVLVRDHGMGIAEDDLERVFRQFERIRTKSYIPGLGLGLYISKGIVESHGGKIQCESTLGEGSTFILELPFHCTANAVSGEAPVPA
jgi:signal transduction histidine kinase